MNSNKAKNPDISKAQGKSNSDVLQFTCCCACNGTFQQVTVKGYGNWKSAKGRCFMPFSNCAPLFHVIFVLVFCLFIFLLMYYNVACQITGTKIYTNKSTKNVKPFHLLVIVYWGGFCYLVHIWPTAGMKPQFGWGCLFSLSLYNQFFLQLHNFLFFLITWFYCCEFRQHQTLEVSAEES